MQYSRFATLIKTPANLKRLALSLRWALMIACCWYIWQTMKLKGFMDAGHWLLSLNSRTLFWLIVLLLPINWSLEARKWQILTGLTDKGSFLRAWRSVISGLTLGLVAPHSFGDFAGRTLQLQGNERHRSVGALLVNNLSAYLIVLLFGLPAYFFYFRKIGSSTFGINNSLVYVSTLVFLVAVYSYFNAPRALNLARKYAGWAWLDKYLGVTGLYSKKLLADVLVLALLRYLVFSLQFGLMLWLAGVNCHWLVLFGGIAAVYVVKSSVPGLTLVGDLGLREFSAVVYFKAFGIQAAPVIMASLGIWGVNILLPALSGVVLLLKIKLFGSK